MFKQASKQASKQAHKSGPCLRLPGWGNTCHLMRRLVRLAVRPSVLRFEGTHYESLCENQMFSESLIASKQASKQASTQVRSSQASKQASSSQASKQASLQAHRKQASKQASKGSFRRPSSHASATLTLFIHTCFQFCCPPTRIDFCGAYCSEIETTRGRHLLVLLLRDFVLLLREVWFSGEILFSCCEILFSCCEIWFSCCEVYYCSTCCEI